MTCRVGIIGAGPMGRLHARTVARLGVSGEEFRLARVLDRHHGRAEELASESGAAPSESLDAFFEEVDVAVVAIPTAAHFEISKALLDRGLDVLIEKPLASSIEEGEALVAAAAATRRILQVGHVEWFNPAWREASTRVGKLSRIEVVRLQPYGERGRDIDVVQDLMLHDLDWTTRLIGKDVLGISASGMRGASDRLDEVEAEIRFEGGCEVFLHSSRIHSERRREALFTGSEGGTTANLDRPTVRSSKRRGGLGRLDSTGEIGSGRPAARDPLESQWLEFVKACQSRRKPINDGQVGVDAMRLVKGVRDAVERNSGRSDLDDHTRLRG